MSEAQPTSDQQIQSINHSLSSDILREAKKSVAGGASSTMRVLDYHLPLVIDRVEGVYLWDVDGNQLIDMNMGYGPLIFGHRAPILVEAIHQELDRRGTILGFPHELSHKTAELIKKSFPSIDCLRFSSTGSETTQTAIRLARTYTGRDSIVVFEGHYNGSCDSVFHRYHALPEHLLSRTGYEAIPGTTGMNGGPSNLFVLPWNEAELLSNFLTQREDFIAAVLMEPVMGNTGVIPPKPGFLQAAREATQQSGSLLIFDEVITGFRVARGGAQELYGVQSDLTLLSKALGGGVPVSAVGGRGDIMELLTNGTVFHGGVYSGNPMCMAATLAMQKEFDRNAGQIFPYLYNIGHQLADGLRRIFADLGVPVIVQHVGPMLTLWFLNDETLETPCSYIEVRQRTDADRFIQFQHALQGAGVYVHPNHFESWFLSTAHTPSIINTVLDRVESVARALFK